LQEFIGQDRAIKAIELGLAVDKPGYNVFVTGLTGTGKTSLIRAYLQKLVASRLTEGADYHPKDWCYLYNFSAPDRPRVVSLPQGGGKVLREQMEELLKRLQAQITRAFAGEEYSNQRKQLLEAGEERHRKLLQALEEEAKQEGFLLQVSAMGMMVIPMVDGRPYSQEEYLALEEGQRKEIEARRNDFMKRAGETLEKLQSVSKDTADSIKELDEKVAQAAIARPFRELLQKYKELPEVVNYLEEARAYVLKNLDFFRKQGETPPPLPAMADAQAFHNVPVPSTFQVNVFVDNSNTQGPPIVIESNPNYGNMFGKIERRFFMGAYITDHTMLKAGAMSLANGGYLVVNARDVLINPGVWEGLKRAIKNKEVRVEDPMEQFGFVAPHGLKPAPIPTEVKVIMIGDAYIYHLLSIYDEDFWEIFKVKADFDFQIDKTPANIDAYCAFISSYCEAERLRHLDRSGVARVVEYGARLVGDQEKLSARFGLLKDILIEADYWARKNNHEVITAEHVEKALEEKLYRSNLVEQRIRELIARGTLMVDVEGEVVGQVNGLSVYDLGDISFGKPSRITAKTFMGRAGIINIEREAQLSGRTHDKGVLILSGYLGWKYAQDKPLSLSASLCFEQSYEGIEGDSASSTELYAILSSIAEVPLKQGIAVTGSVNQKGEIQPIGGVNQKIEGFFQVCQAKGLTGEQGVMIPYQNVKHLMLREEVVQAVREGKFHIYAVRTIDEGLELLTGKKAGQRRRDGTFPKGTVNYLVDQRLRRLAEGMKSFQAGTNERKGRNNKGKETSARR
jgi:lon-related putative ATP-dependent protease